ncbi:MAG: GYD domain-containing protein [SAR202 cluster bacterium]|nr:GYD domain-containing protein [SAR202 cluster bacterium]MDP6714129.1 GYD domain-containing protein [SAR202 cluster bacterium]
MAKYLVTASYTTEGAKGLLADGGTKRREVVENLVNGMGGSMELFYYAFGGNDAYIVADIPDHATMTAISLAVAATGSVSVNTTVLITPEEVDEAAQKTVNYTRPGA